MNRRRFLATSLTATAAATLGFRLNAANASDFAFEPFLLLIFGRL